MNFDRCDIVNFLSYFGENRFDFGGTTIILGQNNTGKSKLFDAINWALFDQAYHTETETWRKTAEWRLNGLDLINRRALQEASSLNQLKALVRLHIETDTGERCVVERTLSVRLSAANEWQPCTDELVVYQTKLTGDTVVHKNESSIAIMHEIAPLNLQPYFLFQGESVSQLLKLSDTRAYGRAINQMARIDVLDLTVDACKLFRERMNRMLRDVESHDNAIKRDRAQLSQEIEKLEVHFDTASKEKSKVDEAFKDLSQQIGDINTELSRVAEFKSKLDKLNGQEYRLEEKRKQYADHQASARKRVSDWISVPAASVFKEFLAVFSRLSEAKVVPQAVQDFFLKEVIERNHCGVCNRDLDPTAADYVRRLLTRIAGRQSVEGLTQLATLVDSDLRSIERFDEEIRDWQVRDDDIWQEIGRVENAIAQSRAELKEVVPHSTDSAVMRAQFDERKRELRRLEEAAKEFEFRSRVLQSDITEFHAKLTERQNRLRKLTAKGGNEKEGWASEVAERLFESASALKERYRTRIAEGIERTSNLYFQEMTQENAASVGELNMDLKSGGVYMVGPDGQPIDNVNQATRVSMQLSFIAGLLSEAGEALGTTLPFVADAPVSSLGGDNKLAAVRAICHAFDQSIIILKDDATSSDVSTLENDPIRQFIKGNEVDTAYLLQMAEGDTSSQYSTIVPIKGRIQ